MRGNLASALSTALASIRFSGPLEREFRNHFDQQGRASRLQLWVILVVYMACVLVFHRALLKVPPEVLPLGRQLIAGVMIPVVLRWLSTAWSPLHRWSAALYIVAVFIDIACLMVLRVACLNHGYDTVPLIMPIALLLSLIVVQIRFLVLAPVVVLGLAGVVGVELWAFETDSNRLFQIAAASALVLVGLSPAYDLERWARIGWLRERRLAELARTDPLTGLANRRHFDTALHQVIRMAARERRNVALMMLDVDHFKSYNDHYGHPAGDECLGAIARHLGDGMRRSHDFAARVGGEEFAVVWFDVGAEDAHRLAEDLRSGISGLGIEPAPGRGTAVTASAGVVQVIAPHPEEAAEDIAAMMVRQADAALYRAKRSGRDRLVVADGLAATGEVPGSAAADADEPDPGFGTAASGLLSRLGGALRFEAPLEAEFRDHFEQQGRSSRSLILIGLLAVVVFILMFDRSLLKIPEEARLLGQLTLIFGLAPAAVAGLLGSTWRRLHRASAALYIGAIGVIVAAQMLERVLQLPQGYDVVPLMMPIAVLLSLSVVQIRFPLLAPSLLLLTAGVLGVELWAFEASSNRLLEVATAIVMVLVTLNFSCKVERSARLGWLRQRRLDELARTDALTGLANRHHFDVTLHQVIGRAARERRNVALMVLDVDHFKSYNDHYGHPAGDECLAAIGRRIGGGMRRPCDFAARLGGEEFAAVWFDANTDDAPRLAEALRRSLSTPAIAPAPGHGEAVTASAGFVQVVAPHPESAAADITSAMMRQADAALYEAKRAGRDRLVMSPPPD